MEAQVISYGEIGFGIELDDQFEARFQNSINPEDIRQQRKPDEFLYTLLIQSKTADESRNFMVRQVVGSPDLEVRGPLETFNEYKEALKKTTGMGGSLRNGLLFLIAETERQYNLASERKQ